jgi:hypothetical protein
MTDGFAYPTGSTRPHSQSGIRQPSSLETRPIEASLVDSSNEVGLRYLTPGPCLAR